MPWKMDGDRVATVEHEGKHLPVFVNAKGEESPFDGDGTVGTISRLNGEAMGHRKRAEDAEKALKGYEGLDASAAREALDKISRLDEKKLIDAGDRDKAVDAAVKQRDAHWAPFAKKAEDLEQQLYSEKIGGAFARSKFISDKLAIPADIVQARFGSAFKIEDGKAVAYDANGQKIFSPLNPGEVATFEEAISVLVDQYPQKDSILKGSGASGGGAQGSGGSANGSKIMKRVEFDKKQPGEQAKLMREGWKLTD